MDASPAAASSPRTAEVPAGLVSIDTSSRKSNLALMGCVRDHLDAHGISYRVGTDAAGEKPTIRPAGMPTIICGTGNIAQAHQPDERIAQDQPDTCDAFIRRLVDRVLI